MNKFDLVDAANKVYSKAEEIYKGSEINIDTLSSVIDKFFSDVYSEKQLQDLKDFFVEQEEIFYEMEDADEIKTEGYWEDREAEKCYSCKNIIPEGEKYIIDGQQYCLDCKGDAEEKLMSELNKIDKDYKCFEMSSMSGMLDQNKYSLQEPFKPSDDNWVGKMKDTNGTFFDLYQVGNKFYDVLGNEIDKSIVIDHINKSKKTESYSELPQMEIYEMIQTARNIDNQDKETNIKETIEAIKCDYPEINEEELAEYVKLKADEIYAGEYDESKKVVTESNEITIPGLTSYENIADTFKNYRAFVSNFEPIIIVKINRQYYVYKLDARDSQDYKYQTDSKDNIEGWLYGAVQANNKIFKDITRESKEVKTESTEYQFIVGLSNRTVKELIELGEHYDKYVKKVVDDEAGIFEYTDNKDEAERFGEKYDANYIAGKLKEISEFKSVVVLPVLSTLQESLPVNELLNNLSTIQTGIQKETGCFVTIDVDRNSIQFTVKGNSQQLIKMLTWERELNKTLELFDYAIQKPIIREDNRYVYNIVEK